MKVEKRKKLPFDVNHYVYLGLQDKSPVMQSSLFPWNDGRTYNTLHKNTDGDVLVISEKLYRNLSRPIQDVITVVITTSRKGLNSTKIRDDSVSSIGLDEFHLLLEKYPKLVGKTIWIVGPDSLLQDTFCEAKLHLVVKSQDPYCKDNRVSLPYPVGVLDKLCKHTLEYVGKHISSKLYHVVEYRKIWFLKPFIYKAVQRSIHKHNRKNLSKSVS